MSYFEIGLYQPKLKENLGTLWRSAYLLGAAGIFTIGARYKKQPSDCHDTMRQVPLRHYPELDDFLRNRPLGAVLVGIETGGTPLAEFQHPAQAVYLLGAEHSGLPLEVRQKCNSVVSLESLVEAPYNVAVAGSLVLYHRCFLQR
ncbi:MAG: RNA methyltransferase [SAR324 cluster bacterium]|nr:RNA methyltransferase [SAR324 cluster bacterium]